MGLFDSIGKAVSQLDPTRKSSVAGKVTSAVTTGGASLLPKNTVVGKAAQAVVNTTAAVSRTVTAVARPVTAIATSGGTSLLPKNTAVAKAGAVVSAVSTPITTVLKAASPPRPTSGAKETSSMSILGDLGKTLSEFDPARKNSVAGKVTQIAGSLGTNLLPKNTVLGKIGRGLAKSSLDATKVAQLPTTLVGSAVGDKASQKRMKDDLGALKRQAPQMLGAGVGFLQGGWLGAVQGGIQGGVASYITPELSRPTTSRSSGPSTSATPVLQQGPTSGSTTSSDALARLLNFLFPPLGSVA